MNTNGSSRTAALTGAAVLISAAAVFAAGCGSSSSSSDTSTERAAAATQQIALTPTAPADVVAEKVSNNVGDTLVLTIACATGDTWKSLRSTPLVTKASPGSPSKEGCVNGEAKWSFDSTAAGTQKITLNGKIAADGSFKRAAVVLTVAGPATKDITIEEGPAGEKPPGQDVTLAVGETLLVTAACNPSTGDSWNYLYPASSNVIARSTAVKPPQGCVAPEGSEPGAPGQQQFALDAKEAGTVRVGFFHRSAEKKGLGRGALNITVQ